MKEVLVEFYLDIPALPGIIRILCKAPQNLTSNLAKHLGSLVRDLYSKVQQTWEMEDQFANELTNIKPERY